MSVTWLEAVGSTNTEIKNAILAGKPEKTAIAAFEQRGGYGRQGRDWSSPPGGLYLSALLRPFDHGVSEERISTLALIISLAVKRMLVSWGLEKQTQIKWPNDVLVAQGKISGISVELVDGAACVGIGVNVFEPSEFTVKAGKKPVQSRYALSYLTSFIGGLTPDAKVSSGVLSDEQRRFIQGIADSVLSEVYSVYDQWLIGGFSHLRGEYHACSALHGQEVRLLSLSEDILTQGTVCDIDEQGCLVLRLADGSFVHARSGEVHLV